MKQTVCFFYIIMLCSIVLVASDTKRGTVFAAVDPFRVSNEFRRIDEDTTVRSRIIFRTDGTCFLYETFHYEGFVHHGCRGNVTLFSHKASPTANYTRNLTLSLRDGSEEVTAYLNSLIDTSDPILNDDPNNLMQDLLQRGAVYTHNPTSRDQ